MKGSIHFENKKISEQKHIGGKIVIGNNVWIGANCVILKNVTIEDNCIIGDKESYKLTMSFSFLRNVHNSISTKLMGMLEV